MRGVERPGESPFETDAGPQHFDAIVIGAGFSGLYALIRLRRLGLRALVIEKGSEVGGTWYWNQYPGARCDIESMDYCYSFSRELLEEWVWSERFASQSEILRYLQHVADRFDLRQDIRFSTQVTEAVFDEASSGWRLRTAEGDTLRARFLVMAVGNLSEPKRPDIPGFDSFQGEALFTARWPHRDVDLSGKRVGVIGTGSTGIQVITRIAEQAGRLYVFQRTPNYSMPARNVPLGQDYVSAIVANYGERRRCAQKSDAGVPFPPPDKTTFEVSQNERERRYEEGWRRGGINALSYAFSDYFTDEAANGAAQDFARRKIREIVKDPETAEALCPAHHIGTKRTCVDTGYFEVYNRDNVTLINLKKESIQAITATGVVTSAGEYAVDSLVYAVGFDAMTGALKAIDIRGRGGVSLRDSWRHGPRTYLGISVAGYPNMFIITGPGSPSVLSNMVVSIEQHVDWIAECLDYLVSHDISVIEATEQSQDEWVSYVNDLANATLYPQASSWYLGANVEDKPRVFMPYVNGCGNYRRECDDVARQGYRGFAMSTASRVMRRTRQREERR